MTHLYYHSNQKTVIFKGIIGTLKPLPDQLLSWCSDNMINSQVDPWFCTVWKWGCLNQSECRITVQNQPCKSRSVRMYIAGGNSCNSAVQGPHHGDALRVTPFQFVAGYKCQFLCNFTMLHMFLEEEVAIFHVCDCCLHISFKPFLARVDAKSCIRLHIRALNNGAMEI